jgi:hypothetical protein
VLVVGSTICRADHAAASAVASGIRPHMDVWTPGDAPGVAIRGTRVSSRIVDRAPRLLPEVECDQEDEQCVDRVECPRDTADVRGEILHPDQDALDTHLVRPLIVLWRLAGDVRLFGQRSAHQKRLYGGQVSRRFVLIRIVSGTGQIEELGVGQRAQVVLGPL